MPMHGLHRTPHEPPSPNNNRTTNERTEARALRATMDAKQQQDRSNEKAVVEAHRTTGGGPKAGSTVGAPARQDGKINLGG